MKTRNDETTAQQFIDQILTNDETSSDEELLDFLLENDIPRNWALRAVAHRMNYLLDFNYSIF